MAKGKRRKFRKYLRGAVVINNALSTLAANTALSVNNADVLQEKAWLSSVVLRWSMDNFTLTANAGPILVGVAHSDYTTAEIEEWIENLASWESGDQIGQEVGRRKIRQVGIIRQPTGVGAAMTLNDGKPIKTKCGWQLVTGQTVKAWSFNMGTAALNTTSPNVSTEGHANLWPN